MDRFPALYWLYLVLAIIVSGCSLSSAESSARNSESRYRSIANSEFQISNSPTAGFCRLIETAQRRFSHGSLAAALRWLITQIGYEQELERTCADPNERAARWNVVQEVVSALAEFEARHPSRANDDSSPATHHSPLTTHHSPQGELI